jgi:hypothetical protein
MFCLHFGLLASCNLAVPSTKWNHRTEHIACDLWILYIYMISNESYVSPRVTPLFILLCSCFVCRKVRVWKATWESALGQTFVLPKRSPTPTACHSMSSCSVLHLAKALSQTWQNGPVHHISRWYLIQLHNNTKICWSIDFRNRSSAYAQHACASSQTRASNKQL